MAAKEFPIAKDSPFPALEKALTKELAKPTSGGIGKSKVGKSIAKLEDEDRMALVVSLCERTLWGIENEQWGAWYLHEILSFTFGKKKLAWSTPHAERVAEIMVKLGDDDCHKIPVAHFVTMMERTTPTPKLRTSLKKLAKRFRGWESVLGPRFAKRLDAI